MKSVLALCLVFSVAGMTAGGVLHPQTKCEDECDVCEALVAPKLRSVHRSCPECGCARRLVNVTASCPALPLQERFCLQGAGKDSRGCPVRHCADTHAPLGDLLKPLRSCAKVCAGGYRLDARSGLPACACVCPIDEVAPRHRWGFCARQCRGRRFAIIRNPVSGCQECLCEEGCPDLRCHRLCPHGYVQDDSGCPLCKCRESAVCPPPPEHCENACGPEGRLRDPETGCVISCECQPRGAIPKVCPVIGCNVDCGPHPMVTVQQDGCVTGCSCRCRVPKDCPRDELHAGICIERVRDQYGCPTCECARRTEVQPANEMNEGVVCPEMTQGEPSSPSNVCPNECSTRRLFDGERKCHLCDCCPVIRKDCPKTCEKYHVDQWGCRICACVRPSK